MIVGIGELRSGRSVVHGEHGEVNQFVFVDMTVAAVRVLRVEEFIAKARQAEDARAGQVGACRDEAPQVIVARGHAAGAIEEVANDNLVLAKAPSARAIHLHRAMHAAKGFHGIECNIEAQRGAGAAAEIAALEPHLRVVEHFLLVVNHRAGPQLVAHRPGRDKHVV